MPVALIEGVRRLLPLSVLLALCGCGREGFAPSATADVPGSTATPGPSGTATPAAGSVDPGFGTAGRAALNFDKDSKATSAIAGPNGTVLVAGRLDLHDGKSHVGVARFDSTGMPDANFGANGWADIGLSDASWADAIALAPDGKIWVAATQDGDHARATLVRLNADGSQDSSFSALDLGPGAKDAEARSLGMRADGSFFAGAWWKDDSGNEAFGIALLDGNGASVSSFGTHGFLRIPCPSSCDLSDVGVDANGHAVIGGVVNDVIVVTKVRADGSNDPGFTTWSSGFSPKAALSRLTVLADGRILLAGSVDPGTGDDLAIVRLTASGAPDTSFSGDGIAIFDLGDTSETASRALALPDGTIAVSATSTGLGILGLQANGSLDTAFGNYGWASTSALANDESVDLIAQPTGLVVAGTAQSDPKAFVLARFLR